MVRIPASLLIVLSLVAPSLAPCAEKVSSEKKSSEKKNAEKKSADRKSAEKKSTEKRREGPPLKDLLRYNAEILFGGKLELHGDDRFEVVFNKSGQMARGFEGKGILDDKSPEAQGANRKFYMAKKEKKEKEEKPIDGLACLGIAQGVNWNVWTSRFPVAGDVKVTFQFRVPNFLTRQSGFLVRVNQEKSVYLETDFFHIAGKYAGGKLVFKRETPLEKYSDHPSQWLSRKGESFPVEVSVADGKLHVRLSGEEIVSLEKVGDVPRGKVVFAFKKLTFTLQNLKISGKLDREWCEKEIEALQKAGKLALQPPEEKGEEPGAAPGPGKPEGSKPAGKKPAGKKEGKEGKDDGEEPL